MPEGHYVRSHRDTHFLGRDGELCASAQQTTRQNRLLAALPLADYERLLPDLEPVSLLPGRIIHRAGDPEKYLCFPTAGAVSRLYVTQNGSSAGFAVTGNEGAVGVASFLSGESSPSQSVVLSAGHGLRLGAAQLKDEFERFGALAHLLLRYTQTLITQIGQTAVCNRHHSLKQQLRRLILSIADRSPTNELTLTQEVIAYVLGVRREGVTEAAGRLQRAGLIGYSRGHIAVLDRLELEAQVCECYAVIKRDYDRLLPPENAIGSVGVHGTCRSHHQVESNHC